MKAYLFVIFTLLVFFRNAKSQTPAISREVLNDMIKSIPTPLETTFLIEDLGIKYNQNLLNGIDDQALYMSDFKKALYLGVYGADMGYANIYGQSQDALLSFVGVQGMAKDLNIEHLIDYQVIKPLINRGNNLDSLLLVTNMTLEDIHDHFQEKNRADLTILILTGGWVEMLYLVCEANQQKPNVLLNNRIGEQKIILEQLLLLLSFYEVNGKVKELMEDLGELRNIYDQVRIAYEYNDSSVKEEDGILVVEDNTTSQITFTSETLENILKNVEHIRSKIISLK